MYLYSVYGMLSVYVWVGSLSHCRLNCSGSTHILFVCRAFCDTCLEFTISFFGRVCCQFGFYSFTRPFQHCFAHSVVVAALSSLNYRLSQFWFYSWLALLLLAPHKGCIKCIVNRFAKGSMQLKQITLHTQTHWHHQSLLSFTSVSAMVSEILSYLLRYLTILLS